MISDIEGNKYKTVKTGNQVWMAENLRTGKYNDDATIPLVTDPTEWKNLKTPGYCWYSNDHSAYGAVYGALNNWYKVNTGKLCPTGWQVPPDEECTTWTTSLGGESVAGGKMKEFATAHWESPNTGSTNESGFSGLPGGYHNYGTFGGTGYGSYRWSSTEGSSAGARFRSLFYTNASVYQSYLDRESGFSIRCVR